MRKILSLFLFFASLNAEVQQVTLIWQPGLCSASCVKELTKQLYRAPGVEKVDIDEGSGRASIIWKPQAPFSFQQINAALRYVGIRQDLIRLRVRGKITEMGSQLKLISSGDNTPFELLNPITAQANQYAVQWNPSTRQLTPQLKSELLEIQKNGWTVTIEGTFFEPFRSPPNRLIVEQLSTDKSKT